VGSRTDQEAEDQRTGMGKKQKSREIGKKGKGAEKRRGCY